MVWHAATGFVQLDHQKVILGQTVVAKMFISMYDTYSLAKDLEKNWKDAWRPNYKLWPIYWISGPNPWYKWPQILFTQTAMGGVVLL